MPFKIIISQSREFIKKKKKIEEEKEKKIERKKERTKKYDTREHSRCKFLISLIAGHFLAYFKELYKKIKWNNTHHTIELDGIFNVELSASNFPNGRSFVMIISRGLFDLAITQRSRRLSTGL